MKQPDFLLQGRNEIRKLQSDKIQIDRPVSDRRTQIWWLHLRLRDRNIQAFKFGGGSLAVSKPISMKNYVK